MIIAASERSQSVKEYYFSRKLREVAQINATKASAGEEPVINLGIGSPDGMPPASAIDVLVKTAVRPEVHCYQSYVGIPQLREAFAHWYAEYYAVQLDPKTQIQPLAGSKEGVLLTSLAFLNEGDKVLVPDPGYPTYVSASRLAGAVPVAYDLLEETGWQPDFEALEKMDLEGVKIMWTNYPNMPTGGKATLGLYRKLVDFGRRHGILICNDNPYSFILNDDPISILSVEGAMDCALELNTLSKAHNMSGWRIAMVAAAPEVISTILKVKSQMDSGMFRPLQLAAAEALSQGPEWYRQLNAVYARRRVAAAAFFDSLGAAVDPESTGLFLWGKLTEANPFALGALPDGSVPAQREAGKTLGERVSDALLYRYGIFATPGFVFGKNGSDYIRISLCSEVNVYENALRKIS